MKRFWQNVSTEAAGDGFRVLLDGRAIRTQGGAAQLLPTRALAEALADEWRAQEGEVDMRGFPLRDLADLAIDRIRPDRAATIDGLIAYAGTDTLCYRADPDEPLHARQNALWEPLVQACESRHGVRFERISGIVHRPQPAPTMAALRAVLERQDDFTLAALAALVPLAASLIVGLAALETPEAGGEQGPEKGDTGPAALFAAANCEQDWQAGLWGWDVEAEQAREARLTAFASAARFARLARG